MDFLKAELAGMKRKMEEQKSELGNKKYIKRAELEEIEEKQYRKKQFEEKVFGGEKQKGDGNEQASKRKKEDYADDYDGDDTVNIPLHEINRRLRLRKEPILLFGEDPEDTFRRLRKLEHETPLDVILERQKNDFQEMMNEVNARQADEDARGVGASAPTSSKSAKQEKYRWPEARRRVREELFKGTPEDDQRTILYFWKCLQNMWFRQLESRPDDIKRKAEGKRALAQFFQNQSHLKPLFKQLKKRELDADLIPLFGEIVKLVEAGEYRLANDAYLKMAIGNAAWPIGVTQVGIHSRGGREKIFSQHIAHILNDETSRKYIHACKRLMTFCQTLFPSAPSKSMEYKAMEKSLLYPTGAPEASE
eukprot:m.19267 g.19267  ORF g.19267 m.19267 type:complete len:364 (+) comp6525_c0_seq1:133-1224(+)